MNKKAICEIYSCLHKFQLKALKITYIWCKGQNFDEMVQAIKCHKLLKISQWNWWRILSFGSLARNQLVCLISFNLHNHQQEDEHGNINVLQTYFLYFLWEENDESPT
jgi:hypothetical protein